MDITDIKPLPAEQLLRHCDPAQFSFDTTAELEALEQVVGQTRAIDALHFGIGIEREGYNLFVLGPKGLGKHSVVRKYLERQAENGATPADWCYVNNFSQPHKPCALQLPPGRGTELRHDMEQLVEDLRSAIPAAFEAEEYHARIQEIEETLKERIENAFGDLTSEAEKHDITLLRTPHGFAFAPTKKGEVVSPEDYQKLPEKERESIDKLLVVLEDKLSSIIHQQPQWQRETRDKIKELNSEVALFAAGHLIDEIKKKFNELPAVQQYLDTVLQDVIENLNEFRSDGEPSTFMGMRLSEKPSFNRYVVNVLVEHTASNGAPVIYQDHPLYQNIVGRVEHLAQMGALITDFTLIKPGALHLANGGYLVLDALKVLQNPYAWEGLKRALIAGEIRIESLGQLFSLVSTVSLEPEPIPLAVKVVLIGDRILYYLLQAYDPEFAGLFKVAADFEEDIVRNDESTKLYAQLIGMIANKDHLQPLDREAVARVIEHSSRMVEDAGKLSTHVLNIADLLREADYWAHNAGHNVIRREHVQQAIDKKTYREDRIRTLIYERIQQGIILIDIQGKKTGQVNGLSVIDLGNFAFGQPTRITATTHLGEGEVIDIEREVELGGAIHSKGVMILSSFLASRYANNRPLSLSASIVFEQSYGMVEGDSASAGECCALLSSLANAPVKQNLAITGSINQHGQIQAIGGVNEKIEGFFDICTVCGLSGDQGVIIPASNVTHLMLRQDVVDAAASGGFHIYAVETIDQAIELLTGTPAGEIDGQGNFPEGSINQMVETRLLELAESRHEFIKTGKENE